MTIIIIVLITGAAQDAVWVPEEGDHPQYHQDLETEMVSPTCLPFKVGAFLGRLRSIVSGPIREVTCATCTCMCYIFQHNIVSRSWKTGMFNYYTVRMYRARQF